MSKSFFSSQRSYEELKRDFDSQDSSVRWATILELGGRSEPWAKDLISEGLSDPDDEVARAAHEELALPFKRGSTFPSTPNADTQARRKGIFLESLGAQGSGINWATSESPLALELSLRSQAMTSSFAEINHSGPFPQADSIERVLEITHFAIDGSPDVQELVSHFKVDERQVHYYLAAAKYLGLLVESTDGLRVDSRLKELLRDDSTSPITLFHEIAKLIVTIPAIGNTFLDWTSKVPTLDRQIAVDHLKAFSGGAPLSDSTLLRRSRTVYAWASWIRKHLNALQESWWIYDFPNSTPLPNFDRAVATAERLGKREVAFLSRKNFIFPPEFGRTLDEVGSTFSVSRERARQVEKDLKERILTDIDHETNWDWKSDFNAYLNQRLTFDSANLIYQISADSLGEAIATIVLADLGCVPVGKTGRFWTKDKDKLDVQVRNLVSITPMPLAEWTAAADAVGISPYFAIFESELVEVVEELVINPKMRRQHIVMHYLSKSGTAHEHDLAAACGEPPSRSFAEALRRSGIFKKNHLNGHWQLIGSKELDPSESFSNVYESVIHLLDKHGPMPLPDLISRVQAIYPVSTSRIHQALDHESVGRLSDGRVALVAQGARRLVESEPNIPSTGLWFENSDIHLFKIVDDDLLRGSGFAVPTWLQWKFGLTGTPQSISFGPSGNVEQALVITRRGGQPWAGSIRTSILRNEMQKGCRFDIVIDAEKRIWKLAHNHNSCT